MKTKRFRENEIKIGLGLSYMQQKSRWLLNGNIEVPKKISIPHLGSKYSLSVCLSACQFLIVVDILKDVMSFHS